MIAAPDDRPTLLFVDDEEKARKYFGLALANDFEVLAAASVQEALDVLERHGERIAVLVTDQRMPGLQGVDLLKRVRTEWPRIVRMLTTAYSDLDDAIAAVNRGEILRYIAKPWDLDALRAELRQGVDLYLLRRERDLLVEEKLSVRERLSRADRLRSLIAIAAGATHLRSAAPGICAWAMDDGRGRPAEPARPEELELWGQEVRQTQDLIGIHRRLRELDAAAAGGFPDSVSPRALVLAQGFEPEGDAPTLAARRTLLERLLLCIGPLTDHRVRLAEVDGPAGAAGRAMIELRCREPMAAPVGLGLLDVYLIAWHHGGAIRREWADGAARVQVELPRDPSRVRSQEPDAAWIGEQFARLEP